MESITINLPIYGKLYTELEDFVRDFSQKSVFFMQVTDSQVSFIPTIVSVADTKTITMPSEIFVNPKASKNNSLYLSSFAAKFNRLSFVAASKADETLRLIVSIEDNEIESRGFKGAKKVLRATLEYNDDLDSSSQSLLLW